MGGPLLDDLPYCDAFGSPLEFARLRRPRSKLLLAALVGTSAFNLLASVKALPTMVHPHYMISHVILNESVRGASTVIWTLCALVCLFSDVMIVQHLRCGKPPLSRYACWSLAGMAVTCIGWIGAVVWDIHDFVVVHAVMGALYGAGFTCRAAIHSWLIDPLRAQHGLPTVPLLMRVRRLSVLTELAAAPVLVAGLPTLLSKDMEAWSLQEQHLALLSSIVEHIVFVHLRLLFMATFLPDLIMLDQVQAQGQEEKTLHACFSNNG